MDLKKLMKQESKEEPKLWLDIYGDRERENFNGIKLMKKDNNEFEVVVVRCGSGRSAIGDMIILDTI